MNEQTIIKALEICPTSSCARCPLRKRVDCRNFLLKEALKLIRSKAEELNQAMEQLTAAERKIKDLNETMSVMIEQHKLSIRDLTDFINKVYHTEEKADHEEIHGL